MTVNTEPAWYQDMMKYKHEYGQEFVTAPGGPYQIRNNVPNAITLMSGTEEMIRCSPEGFWVRGVKVEQDDREAEVVYNAFKQWLTWAQMAKDYK